MYWFRCSGYVYAYQRMEKRGIERKKFAGLYTPDLLIASNWKLFKNGEIVNYKALVEIKSPTALELLDDDELSTLKEIQSNRNGIHSFEGKYIFFS